MAEVNDVVTFSYANASCTPQHDQIMKNFDGPPNFLLIAPGSDDPTATILSSFGGYNFPTVFDKQMFGMALIAMNPQEGSRLQTSHLLLEIPVAQRCLSR